MLTSDSKNVIIACFTVYELMIREKYEILKEHFHIDSINVTHNEAEDFRQLFSRIADDYDIDRGILQKRISHHDKTPSRNLYISDPHFFHDSLNGFLDHRGFSGFEEMNAYMVKQWNNNVTRKDQVYILGDFSISRGRATNKILDKLNGKKYLIKGNHDRFLEDKEFDRTLFGWVKPYAEVQDEGRKVILSHYPVFCYNGQYRTKDQIGI